MFKDFIRLWYVFWKVHYVKAFRLYDRRSDNVLWLFPNYPHLLKYLGGHYYTDMALLQAFIDLKIPFRIVLGKKALRLQGKRIFYNLSELYNFDKLPNHTTNLQQMVQQLETQGNRMYMPYRELLFWENKGYMHEQFAKAGINQPATFVRSINDPLTHLPLSFPFLWKDPHSASSAGVHKVNDEAALQALHARKQAEGKQDYLLQALVQMRKDLRVTIVGDEVVLAYWRINTEKEWKPTSTTGGSSQVDFGNYPAQWNELFIQNLKKIGLTTGGFDVTWQNDDTSTEPIFLEVSPSYQPNPAPPPAFANIPYAAYKQKLFGRDAYHKKYLDLLFSIKLKLVSIYASSNDALLK
jgi:glutathione synthase/RimK-type ligase-like ATP-grasp enzyme